MLSVLDGGEHAGVAMTIRCGLGRYVSFEDRIGITVVGDAMIDVTYPNLLNNFREHLDPKRSESASFLIWYLEHFYRLDRLEALDAVCDQKGDKGVDGIYVNDADQSIVVFQSKISQRPDRTIGDSSLREFAGTISQFESAETLQNLKASANGTQLVSLVDRHDLVNRVGSYAVRGEFISNINLDKNGEDFIAGREDIVFVGGSELVATYISTERVVPARKPAKFDVGGFSCARYVVDSNREAVIAPVKAIELVALEGIADQSLFAHNVRGPLGRTKVNKDIVRSLNDTGTHKLFPLFHNGITVIARDVAVAKDEITVADYFVVNGCQSLTSMYNNRRHLTDDLRVLAKFIKMDPTSNEAEMITQFSNNQNAVKARDFKSNNQIQIRLQNEFAKLYPGKYCYEIKEGETVGSGVKISNEDAGLYLMAIDLGEPWATHRKYTVFEDKHSELFGRPVVTADRIVMFKVMADAIVGKLGDLDNQLFAKYTLTKFMMLFVAKELLVADGLGLDMLRNPVEFVRNDFDRLNFGKIVGTLVDDIIVDLNAELKEVGGDFDYRDKLRDQKWVKEMSGKSVALFQKLVARGKAASFKKEWADRGKQEDN